MLSVRARLAFRSVLVHTVCPHLSGRYITRYGDDEACSDCHAIVG